MTIRAKGPMPHPFAGQDDRCAQEHECWNRSKNPMKRTQTLRISAQSSETPKMSLTRGPPFTGFPPSLIIYKK